MQTVDKPHLSNIKTLISVERLRELLAEGITEKSHWFKDLSDEELMQQIRCIAQVKYFMYRAVADPKFREQVLTDPDEILAHQSLNFNFEEIKPIWDKLLDGKSEREEKSIPLLTKRYQEFEQTARSQKLPVFVASSVDLRYKAWRERQKARCNSQMVKLISDGIVHSPVTFELSKGCSVGCWFCSVSAPRLNDIFFYTPENAKLWRGVLEVMKGILGQAAAGGFGYWATDPLDNPDYEKFMCDFHEILGIFPQTTTAQPLKNPARTRSLLKLSLEKGCMYNRFSIVSLKILRQLYEEFTPEELAFVELVLQNKEAVGSLKINGGRAREATKRHPGKKQETLDDSVGGTIACVSGFLCNMIDRTVKLISPYPASDRYPHGYRVYDEGNFTSADDLKILLERMIDSHMPLSVRPSDRIRFRPDLKYESLADGFGLSTRFMIFKFRNDPYLKELGAVIAKGDKTAKEIASLFNVCGISSVNIYNSLNLMLNKGVLDDEV
jgi:radical SAM family RiPP maturation amino acid epimerase